MRISINIANFTSPGGPGAISSSLLDLAHAVDESGLDTLWVGDHLIQANPYDTTGEDMLEAYTVLGFLAASTKRVRLGVMVTAVTFRPPSLLIKAVTSLDVLSGGRAWFGIGAGYNEAEARAMGLPLPPAAERFERLEETLRLARHMWSGVETPFEGVHYRLERPTNRPNALSRPHPPILVGGAGEKKTLRLVATYADACNLFDVPGQTELLKRKLGVLAAHCQAVGRPVGEIEKTVSSRLKADDTPAAVAERCAAFAELGIDHLVMIVDGAWTVEDVERLAAVAHLAAHA
ncbi:LLM class F420-dependent oxidoreductase [Actinopolymorpha singaporensis]|uniref:Probable F420-dependent oxidoreductase, Rv1855c family n=1 Tax=Actinopolymorpha singaporensis TaxID=117157 RepID=A0A1H1TV00_9ACTN|nr:LLM class F420-dependent oxidoreductase [Actinopolymorpha singaporensis]SDS64022.1 probable F420-dependent oxidoreductase, Rv1855c family [Actinopolymorpha singaporensis]